MKVVLFCGGLGLRLREVSEQVPKPMVPVGTRPILWHVMKYFAHYGHSDYVLCLGHKAEVIKQYFLNYQEALTNDFVLDGSKGVELLGHDLRDWRINFVDTGLRTNVGGRLRAVRGLVENDEMFLANYGDTLTDAPLPAMIEHFTGTDAVAMFLSVRPPLSFHVVKADENFIVQEISSVDESNLQINGGYFVIRPEIFDYMKPGEEMVEEPFQRIAKEGRLLAYKSTGFWAPMDTLKDKNTLDALWDAGEAPWQVWDQGDTSE